MRESGLIESEAMDLVQHFYEIFAQNELEQVRRGELERLRSLERAVRHLSRQIGQRPLENTLLTADTLRSILILAGREDAFRPTDLDEFAESDPLALAHAQRDDYARQIDAHNRFLWGLLYPNDSDGWEYVTQPLVHIRVELARLREQIQILTTGKTGEKETGSDGTAETLTEEAFLARCRTIFRMGLATPERFRILERWADLVMRLEAGQVNTVVEHLQEERKRTNGFSERFRGANDALGYGVIRLLAVLTHPCQPCAEDPQAWHTRNSYCRHNADSEGA